ncbi:uncharacterized protein LOC120528618 isoform X1 [Polypterus senegalus]|uniref:uncharacterized protein LOC120528618 isoform X1 n=1 Tax=Polypterus senegalus TaxID=55291 RepID=UPI001964562F|nr:uncharacterized protein LOC120528618 isoform X1 [Polypterus senegalus]
MLQLTMLVSCFLVISCYFPVESIKVSQTPLHITVKVGDSVEMMCSWETSQILPRIQVEWKKNNISHVISKKTYLNTTVIEVVNRTTLKILNTSATLHISNTERNDVGKYYCILIYDMPILTREFGNGTELDITEDVAKSNTEIYTICNVLRSLPLVAMVAAVLYVNHKKKEPKGTVLEGAGENKVSVLCTSATEFDDLHTSVQAAQAAHPPE